jgi:hypothetical protein
VLLERHAQLELQHIGEPLQHYARAWRMSCRARARARAAQAARASGGV